MGGARETYERLERTGAGKYANIQRSSNGLAMACFAVGLNGPDSWAVAPTARSLHGKMLAHPCLFGWIEWRPKINTSIMILMAGIFSLWLALPRVGSPVATSRYDMCVVVAMNAMHTLIHTDS